MDTGQHQAPASRDLGLYWDGLWSTLSLWVTSALGASGVPCSPGAFAAGRGGFWSLLQAEFGEQMGKKGEAVRKEQRPSLQSRLNDLHQAEGPWQENEVTSALNPSPED